jgi:hypothetical protein
LSTITRRPHVSTISIRPSAVIEHGEGGEFSTASRRLGNDGKLLVEGALPINTGANAAASSSSKRRPSRSSRSHVNNWLADSPCRRAVAETCRRPIWLSAIIRRFSATIQRRRAPVDITSMRETFDIGVWSVIRLCLHPHAPSHKAVLAGGIHRVCGVCAIIPGLRSRSVLIVDKPKSQKVPDSSEPPRAVTQVISRCHK